MTVAGKHCYLLALEIVPLEVGEAYDELPMHCTLMHRFWSDLPPAEIVDITQNIFERTSSTRLVSKKRELLGPKQVPVSLLEKTDELADLHSNLFQALNGIGVEYTAPEWVGDEYTPHATERKDLQFLVGSEHISTAAYLIEVKVPGYGHKRIVRHKFELQE